MSQRRQPTRVILLGSTGSIGTQTVEVIEHLRRHGEPFEVVGLCAGGSNLGLLAEQAVRLGVPAGKVAIGRAAAGGGGGSGELPAELRGAVFGAGAAEALVRETPCDVVVAAMVGASGLGATLAAVELGRRVALANKETLVAAGGIIVPAAERTGALLLPVDSEHSAVWQCLQGRHGSASARGADGSNQGGACVPPMRCDGEVRRVILTASGGALRHLSAEAARRATPAEALKHPTWSMGAKVTIDSASLTNKAFELIEAHHLFGLEPERLAVVIHPQSLVHSMVEFADGSVMAQISPPDMRLPIQYALTFPARVEGIARRVDWLGLGSMARMEFSVPEAGRYPALAAAERVMRVGGTSGAIFNGASEVAVEAFLAAQGAMRFGEMADVACAALEGVPAGPAHSLADVLAADRAAREWAREWLARAGFGEQVGVSSGAAP